jgi:hypothetical protein
MSEWMTTLQVVRNVGGEAGRKGENCFGTNLDIILTGDGCNMQHGVHQAMRGARYKKIDRQCEV